MGSTLIGLVFLAFGTSYGWLLAGAALIGIGSAVFHPEASRVARAAAGGKFGTAQSLFQVGGNTGSALGPLLAAFIVVPLGRAAVGAFAAAALLGMSILAAVGRWHETPPPRRRRPPRRARAAPCRAARSCWPSPSWPSWSFPRTSTPPASRATTSSS
jgi:MFS transporter, FSR family, fosmidomycin resistance protein